MLPRLEIGAVRSTCPYMCALSEILTRPYKLPVIFRKFHGDLRTVLMRWEKSALCRRKKRAAFGDPNGNLTVRFSHRMRSVLISAQNFTIVIKPPLKCC